MSQFGYWILGLLASIVGFMTFVDAGVAIQVKVTPVWTVKCHDTQVVDVLISHDLTIIASADDSGTIMLSKYEWPEPVSQEDFTGSIRELEWQENGDLIALKDSGKIMRLRHRPDDPLELQMVAGWDDGRRLLRENGKIYVVERERFGLLSGESYIPLETFFPYVATVNDNRLLLGDVNLKLKTYDLAGNVSEIALKMNDPQEEKLLAGMSIRDLEANDDSMFVLFSPRYDCAIAMFDSKGSGKIIFSAGHSFGWAHESVNQLVVSKAGRYLISCGEKCRVWDVKHLEITAVIRGSVDAEQRQQGYFTCAYGVEREDGKLDVVFGTVDGYLGRFTVTFN